MKNQYIGDIGDYGKYGLLRFLRDSGIAVGVNWYLTPDDERNDGCHTEYLADARMRRYDPALFDALSGIAHRTDKCITQMETCGALDGMCFYHEPMDFAPLHWQKRPAVRAEWHNGALASLQSAELVFADPDNSLSSKKKPTSKDAEKFALPSELSDYYLRGQQVMYYHHRSRKNETGWIAEKRQMLDLLPDAQLLALAFRRWSSRCYIFVVHPEQYERYRQLTEQFLASPWGVYRIDGKVAFTTEVI